jgi:hypothetical protein
MSDSLDAREQLCNDRRTGSIYDVQLPTERVTRLHGIMIDLDPGLLLPSNPYFPPADDPRAFYQAISPVLSRHPLARQAEVRASGRGLHVLIWMDPPVELASAADQQHWDHIVRAVQATLPGDPNAPGITALTRPVGSVNGKNRAVVEVLKAGQPVTPAVVVEFLARLVRAPFSEVAVPLLGGQRVQPCPVCRRADSRLDVLEQRGMCYSRCSKVDLAQLYDVIFDGRRDQTGPTNPEESGRPEPETVVTPADAAPSAERPRTPARHTGARG